MASPTDRQPPAQMRAVSVRFREADWQDIRAEAALEGISAASLVREACVARLWYGRGTRDGIEAFQDYNDDPAAMSDDYGAAVAGARESGAFEGDLDLPATRGNEPMRVHAVRFGEATYRDIDDEARVCRVSVSRFIRDSALSRMRYLRGLRREAAAQRVAGLIGDAGTFDHRYRRLVDEARAAGILDDEPEPGA